MSIITENARTDGRATWNSLSTLGYGDINAQGFVRQVSVNVGETVDFSVDGSSITIDIYRCGWYGGDGFRLWASIENTPTVQPEAEEIPNSFGGTTCTNWSITASWSVPVDAVSGMYLALIRSVPPYAPNAFYATFVVRDDSSPAEVVYKTSDSTWLAAYNHYGTKSNINGKNVYGSGTGVGAINQRSVVGDYHRPVITRGGVVQTYWWACEMPLIRWMERNGYDMKYISCVDLDKQGVGILTKSSVFLSSGHDEYWTRPMRTAVESFRDDHGGNSIFMSGNEVFWKARYEYDGDRTTLVCYKDTMPGPDGTDHIAGTPLDPVEWTGTWKDPRWPQNEPEWLLTGTDFRMNGVNDFDATIPRNPYSGLPVWGNSSLNDGDIVLQKVIGFEADSMRPTQPEGSVRILAAYTRNIDGMYADDAGQTYSGSGTLDWGIISQRYTSGAVTVGFGTCQWSWVLDGTHDRGATQVQPDAQQFTLNLLNDLGASPQTPAEGMVVQSRNVLANYGLNPLSGKLSDSSGQIQTMYKQVDGKLIVVETPETEFLS